MMARASTTAYCMCPWPNVLPTARSSSAAVAAVGVGVGAGVGLGAGAVDGADVDTRGAGAGAVDGPEIDEVRGLKTMLEQAQREASDAAAAETRGRAELEAELQPKTQP